MSELLCPKLDFVKRIDTKMNSIFYSFIHYNNVIIGFGRRHYGTERIIKVIIIDKNFNIIEDNEMELIKGEDPRCFMFNGKLYIQDNFLSDMYLFDYINKKYIKINISGKNISFIEHNHSLYFIHYMKPFVLYKFDVDTGVCTKIDVDNTNNTPNSEYRGGTPGYKLSDNQYYGFGHKTYTKNNVITHDIFKWILYFDSDKPRIVCIDIKQPPNSNIICDPTSVITIDDNKYLITAESQHEWNRDQDYITNLYKITDSE